MLGQVAQNVEGKGQDQEKTADKAKSLGDHSQSQDRLALGVMTLNDFTLWSELSLKTFIVTQKETIRRTIRGAGKSASVTARLACPNILQASRESPALFDLDDYDSFVLSPIAKSPYFQV